MEQGKSSSTVGQSRESLARGAQILLAVSNHGVVKSEEPADEAEIQRQIEVLTKQQALLRDAKAAAQQDSGVVDAAFEGVTEAATLNLDEATQVEADLAQEAEAARLLQEKAEADRVLEEAKAHRLAKAREAANVLAEQKAEADRLAKDRLAKEKAKADRLAQAEAERLAQEKAEADRLLQEKAKADRLAQEKAEADRLAQAKAEADRLSQEKAEADRLAKEKAEADRLAQAEADRLARERLAQAKAEADRLAQAEADRLTREKAEADRLVEEKTKADRLAQAEADRLSQEKAEADRLAQAKLRDTQEEIKIFRAKKAELEKNKATLARLQKELEEELKVTDAIMQSQQAPLMPGSCKVETPSPAGRVMTPTEALSPISTSTSSQDAQDPWICRRLSGAFDNSLSPETTTPPSSAKMPGAPQAIAVAPAKTPGPAPPKAPAPKHGQPAPFAVKARPQSPPPSSGAITKRLLRVLEPNARGVYKVSKEVRDQFHAGGISKSNVYKMFAECNNNPETFVAKFSAVHEKQRELQLTVDFEFLTKQQMADEQNMSPDDIAKCVAAAEADPVNKIRRTDRLTLTETRQMDGAGEGTEPMEVDLNEALQESESSRPASYVDAADGLTQSNPPNEEVSRLLKRLGYPEVHDCKASALIDKAVSACTKRLKKLAEMYNKIRSVYAAVDGCSEKLEKFKADGMVDGFSEELLGSILFGAMLVVLDGKLDRHRAGTIIEAAELENRARTLLSRPPSIKKEMAADAKVNPKAKTLRIKAPACIIGEVADAVLSDGSRVPGLIEAAKVDKNHSERNAHRLFNKYGLALKVPIDNFGVPQSSSGEAVTVPYLSISKYMQRLLDSYEQLMFGGLSATASEVLLGTFWSRFRAYHPKHLVYSDASMSEAERVRTVPVCIHGDKGRTLQKSPIYVLSFEFPFGLPPSMLKKCSYDEKRNTRHVEGKLAQTCGSRAKKRTIEEVDFSECTRNDPPRYLDASKPRSHQRHNNRGHSFLSRFLVCAIPSKTYKKNPELIPNLLREVAKELKVLFESGLKQGKTGARFRFAFIGAKGDSEWHFEAGNFTRSYHRIGPVNPAKICHLCDAGAQGLPYTDVSSAPEWLSTLGAEAPWRETPPLNQAPFSESFPAFLYKFDPFHVLKYGVFRDCCASTVTRLGFLGYFDFSEEGELENIPDRLMRAFSLYKLWCLAEKKNPSLKGFTRINMHFDKNTSFAWFNCKGSEVTLLMQWLDFQLLVFIANVKHESQRTELRAMHQMIRGGLNYI
ncbi:unnamed protein product, partial [Symbiodinium sp. CCMP2456]